MNRLIRAAAPHRSAWLAAASLFAMSHAASAAITGSPCQALASTSFPLDGVATVTSISATDIPAITYGGLPIPAFCYVSMVIASNGDPTQSQIAVIVGLPENGAWNGRFVGTGNGGFAGAVSLTSAALYISQGYAAANTDLGTGILYKCNGLYCGSTEGTLAANGAVPLGGLYGHPQAIRDFGYAATHLMTIAGKQLIQAYYSTAPSYSYFHGCSTGGSQALMEAQRFPLDYNGIVAGSPAYDRTHLHIAGAASYEATHFASDSFITTAAATLTHKAVLAACAGTDGGLATDTYLTQPAKCGFDATALQCTGATTDVPCTDPNAASCSCLTPDEATTMNTLWSGAKDSLGRVLYPGLERSVEDPNATGGLGPLYQETLTEPFFDSLDYWAYGTKFTWQKLFSVTNALQGELLSRINGLDNTAVAPGGAGSVGTTFATVMNANSGNLSAFAEAGGKLVMYAGYEDQLIPTASSIDYFNAVAKDDPQYNYYLRLFLAPGVLHCSGGPGANAFGNLGTPLTPTLGNPSGDVFAAMTNWVENGQSVAPSTVLATKFVNDSPAQGIAFQRPLCAYPDNAKYKGTGDATQAANWVCAKGSPVTNQRFAAPYGPK